MKIETKSDDKKFSSVSFPTDEAQVNVHHLWKKVSFILVIFLVGTIGYVFFNNKSDSKVPEDIIRYHLAKFVMNMRSVSSDAVVVRRHLEEAYAFSTLKGKSQLDKILKSINLDDKLTRKIAVAIHITSIKRKHETLYTVIWTESEYQNSKVVSVFEYEGFFRLEFARVIPSKDSFLINPSGIYINSIVIENISKPTLGS